MMFSTAIEEFLKALGAAQYSPHTLSSYASVLRGLREHVAVSLGREPQADEIDRDAILNHGRERMKRLGRRAMDHRLYTLRSFFKWLEAAHEIANPISRVIMPRAVPLRLRKAISPEQVASIIAIEVSPGARSRHELRDRALVEVLYGSGIRVSEAISLNWEDLGGGKPGDIRITAGKGGDDRVVIVGEPALDALAAWHRIAPAKDLGAPVFQNRRGERLTVRAVELMIRDRAALAGIPDHVSPHTLRHSFATSLLERGAGIADIGALLGHHRLSTTTLYTHANAEYLRRQIAFHPRADVPGQKDIRGFCELYGLSEATGRRLLEMPLRDWMIEENGQRRIDLARFNARFAMSPSSARRHQV
jgi:site-specific recombinase XerD